MVDEPALISNKDWYNKSSTGWGIGMNDNIWQWNYRGANGTRKDMDTGGDIADNQWHNITVTHDRDGYARFYQDGYYFARVYIADSTGTIDAGLPTVIAQDGTTISTIGSGIIGGIDDILMYRRVLTDQEVKTIYYTGIGETIPAEHSTSFQNGVNGYTGTVDTMIAKTYPNSDFSNFDSISVDLENPDGSGNPSQILIRFRNIFGTDPGQIPPGSQILSARLVVDINDNGNGARIHRMKRDWADTDTWNSLENGIQIDDIEAQSAYDVNTHSIMPLGECSLDVKKSVQAWSDGEPNYGWIFMPRGNGTDIYTSEETVNAKPQLSVVYSY